MAIAYSPRVKLMFSRSWFYSSIIEARVCARRSLNGLKGFLLRTSFTVIRLNDMLIVYPSLKSSISKSSGRSMSILSFLVIFFGCCKGRRSLVLSLAKVKGDRFDELSSFHRNNFVRVKIKTKLLVFWDHLMLA